MTEQLFYIICAQHIAYKLIYRYFIKQVPSLLCFFSLNDTCNTRREAILAYRMMNTACIGSLRRGNDYHYISFYNLSGALKNSLRTSLRVPTTTSLSANVVLYGMSKECPQQHSCNSMPGIRSEYSLASR